MESNKLEHKKENRKKNKNSKFSVKTYIRDFLIFVDKNIIKSMGILLVIAILLIAISLSPMIDSVIAQECEGTCRDGVTLFSDYRSKLQILLLTGASGVVPYIYAPILGYIGYILNEVIDFAYIIKGYGYLAGIGIGIVPLILNMLTICIITAMGLYICRTVTVGYRISSLKNMNFMNFRIKLYEALQNEKKVEALTKARDAKIEKLQAKKTKLNYLQILNISVVVCIVQFVSVIIQQVIL